MNHFKQSLEFLNNIKEDTGIARERVLEKLSDVIEASEKANTSGCSRLPDAHDQVVGPPHQPSHKPSHRNPLPPISSSGEGLKTPVRKHVRVVRGGKYCQPIENRQERRDSYDADLTAYMGTYHESSIASSSSETTLQDINQGGADEPRNTRSRSPVYVREGSLALGANTRGLYTTKTHAAHGVGKGKLTTEIVLIRAESVEDVTDNTIGGTPQSASSRVCNIL